MRRRWGLGPPLFGTLVAQIAGLFQTGLERRLPGLPVGPFDATKVDASDYAYKRLQVPDGAPMLLTRGATAALAAAVGRDRAERDPAQPIALAAKTAWDVATNLRLAREEWSENRALCAYRQTASPASIASLVLALREAARAGRSLTRR